MWARISRVACALVLAFLVSLYGGCAPTPSSPRPQVVTDNAEELWEIVAIGNAAVAVPKGSWQLPKPLLPEVLFREGHGRDYPLLDETGAPLQVGIFVEKLPNITATPEQGIQSFLKAAKNEPRLEMVGKEIVESLKLSDGTEAKLLITEFIKEKHRRSLQMKMIAQDQESNGWIVSAFVVGGKESKTPTPASGWARWMRALVTSFCLDGTKIDAEKLRVAQRECNPN